MLIQRGTIPDITQATGAAFLTVSDGWVVGLSQGRHVTSRILHTGDGGRTWQVQYTISSG